MYLWGMLVHNIYKPHMRQ